MISIYCKNSEEFNVRFRGFGQQPVKTLHIVTIAESAMEEGG
jgi:hypothetical protein